MTTNLAIETGGLTRCFGTVRAVDGLDLQVDAGKFYGFLGPNGAGKSTTIKMLPACWLPPAGQCGSWVSTWRRTRLPAR